ncbi:hypothetical protein Ahy_A05g024687 isoform B [Arachis hypogaea]|uniref:Uncharacterized protein n=1 Tax=Arachis hypogaea TaxID=3818 RepID=A0A445D6G1_ARAHY|nr:hypothetical protein Ahy_A05g024687 isoform B [Arachis hypogaea]
MGEMGRGDKRPFTAREVMVRYLRHRGGSCHGVRQRGH